MNTISRFAASLLVAAATVPVWAGSAPYENATSKALHPGKPQMAAPRYVQPRMYAQPQMYAQPRVTATPQVATAPQGDESRRTFSYEPAAAAYAAPAYAAPRAGSYRARHTYENATMKGLGRIQ